MEVLNILTSTCTSGEWKELFTLVGVMLTSVWMQICNDNYYFQVSLSRFRIITSYLEKKIANLTYL